MTGEMTGLRIRDVWRLRLRLHWEAGAGAGAAPGNATIQLDRDDNGEILRSRATRRHDDATCHAELPDEFAFHRLRIRNQGGDQAFFIDLVIENNSFSYSLSNSGVFGHPSHLAI